MLHYVSNLDPQIHLAFTTQAEGNLALHVNDDPHQVRENRASLESRIGVRAFSLKFMNQVHSATVLRLIQDSTTKHSEQQVPTCDGLVSVDAADPLAVMVADCLPVLFVGRNEQAEQTITAAVHAGRRGLLDGILRHTVQQMQELGSDQIEAVIGPAICGACYEVPETMRAESEEVMPGIGSVTRWGSAGLDLPAAASEQLENLGVSVRNSAQCTLENPQYYSYRRSSSSGRIAGVIWKTA
ncbi:peptidoglycan editing factor PgeF [Glutamicibacter uratoxydans]|uniref:peptidoglycan editing factor PgeF n=1 Tax=Glutamicibacter uratoxydans TaxID=43667 RepID=UPI003D6E3B9F